MWFKIVKKKCKANFPNIYFFRMFHSCFLGYFPWFLWFSRPDLNIRTAVLMCAEKWMRRVKVIFTQEAKFINVFLNRRLPSDFYFCNLIVVSSSLSRVRVWWRQLKITIGNNILKNIVTHKIGNNLNSENI